MAWRWWLRGNHTNGCDSGRGAGEIVIADRYVAITRWHEEYLFSVLRLLVAPGAEGQRLTHTIVRLNDVCVCRVPSGRVRDMGSLDARCMTWTMTCRGLVTVAVDRR